MVLEVRNGESPRPWSTLNRVNESDLPPLFCCLRCIPLCARVFGSGRRDPCRVQLVPQVTGVNFGPLLSCSTSQRFAEASWALISSVSVPGRSFQLSINPNPHHHLSPKMPPFFQFNGGSTSFSDVFASFAASFEKPAFRAAESTSETGNAWVARNVFIHSLHSLGFVSCGVPGIHRTRWASNSNWSSCSSISRPVMQS